MDKKQIIGCLGWGKRKYNFGGNEELLLQDSFWSEKNVLKFIVVKVEQPCECTKNTVLYNLIGQIV